uniref:STM3941 family protein n=1 Tax=uncultured Erythrobacter sp. TaxID=263913 RepID=UPI00262E1835|nr:STM3941 family protein [uncultured Erythrobacter sp.]
MNASLGKDRFEARYSPARSIMLALLAFGFVAIGLWLIGAFGETPTGSRRVPDWAVAPAGWLAIAFFAPFTFFHIKRAFGGGLAVRVDAQGMLLPDYSPKLIRWDDVTSLSTQNMMGTKLLLFDVRDGREADFALFRRATIGFNRSFNGHGCSVTMNNTDRSYDDLLDAVDAFAPAGI